MPLEVIYVVRHGFRLTWTLDHVSGRYSSLIPTPTGLPADPALTSHGVDQSKELAAHLLTIQPPIDVVYSSPYYRCLQTITPYVSLRSEELSRSGAAPPAIRPEGGLGEFYGSAPFDQPIPAEPAVLKQMFPAYNETYESLVTPSRKGETISELYHRVATAVQGIIAQCDAEGARSVILCTHAAVVIALGRVLTGEIPESVDAHDFSAFTCGMSIYRRQSSTEAEASGSRSPIRVGDGLRGNLCSTKSSSGGGQGQGIRGGWLCEANSDCSFLSGGEERGWSFTGDEGFTGSGQSSQNGVIDGLVAAKVAPTSLGESDYCRL